MFLFLINFCILYFWWFVFILERVVKFLYGVLVVNSIVLKRFLFWGLGGVFIEIIVVGLWLFLLISFLVFLINLFKSVVLFEFV